MIKISKLINNKKIIINWINKFRLKLDNKKFKILKKHKILNHNHKKQKLSKNKIKELLKIQMIFLI